MREIMKNRIPPGPDGTKRLNLFGTTINVDKLPHQPEPSSPVGKLMSELEGHQEDLISILFNTEPSEQEKVQAVKTKTNQIIRPFQQPDPSNPFGSIWGEITAQIAANRLNWSRKKIQTHLSRAEPSPAKTEQGLASALLIQKINERLTGRGKELAQRERLERKLNAWVDWARQFGCNQEQAQKVTLCTAKLQLLQPEGGKIINLKRLVELLSNGIQGQTVNLIRLQCLPTINSKKGTQVSDKMLTKAPLPSAGFVTVDQREEIKPIKTISETLSQFEINHSLTFLIVDIDCFILDDRSLVEKAEKFETRLDNLLKSHFANVNVTRLSKTAGLDSPREVLTSSTVSEIINNPFQLLSPLELERRTEKMREKLSCMAVPSETKTFSSAQELTIREFAIDFWIGEKFGGKKEAIFIRRTKSLQAASETFLRGAKQQSPPFIAFWTNRFA